MILNEVLRLYTPTAITFCSNHKRTKLGDLVLPAGMELALHTAIVHRDTEI
jgi:cytochrome P450